MEYILILGKYCTFSEKIPQNFPEKYEIFGVIFPPHINNKYADGQVDL